MNNTFDDVQIPTYVINLKERIDRLEHIRQQFANKPEFDVHIVEASEHPIGAVGLWNSIVKVINIAIENEDDVIIICEDDHIFTKYYSKEYLVENILEAAGQGAKLLSGGIGGFSNAVPISKNRFWIDSFWCTQFIVLYRSFFQKILEVSFGESDTADGIMSELTSNKMVLYPFISIQRDFGYSDVTRSNNEEKGRIIQHFHDADTNMSIYQKVYEKYIEKNIDSDK